MKTLQALFVACLFGIVMIPNVAWSASRHECIDAARAKYGNPNSGENREVILHAVHRCLRHGLDAI